MGYCFLELGSNENFTKNEMHKKTTTIIILIIHCSIRLFSQITSGELKFVLIDSVTNEYDFNDVKSVSPSRDSAIAAMLYNRSDTTIQIVNGEYEIKILNRFNHKDVYEQGRDSVTIFFNKKYTISEQYNVIKIQDFDRKMAANYSTKDGKMVKLCEFKMYADFREAGEIVDFKVDKNDKKYIGGVEGYKIEYREKLKYFTRVVKMYVCEDIKYPIKAFVDFPKDINICPIYREQYNEDTPHNKDIMYLLSAGKVPGKVVANKVKAVIR